jgi:NAD(P)-dependent dehydrogenase (short-subunit alcohol dehydrogenase family)
MALQIDLNGQLVLVTGGTRGIGKGIAERFLATGADVLVCGRHEPEALPAAGDATARYLEADVRDPDAITVLFDRIEKEHGRLDVLINNAGGSPSAEAATASARFAAAILMLNLQSAMMCSPRANQLMQAQDDGGVIVNIGSVSGLRASPGTAAYGAAKAGLINLTQSLAVEWAPKVRVNCVSAGLIATEQSHIHYGDEIGKARVAATVPAGRLGTPQDVGDACVFLASSLATYISGANLLVHGGGEKPAFLEAASGEGS